ncbi:ABC transporter ATP-binding protein [Microlunatus parietis]|uniref:ABC-type multidrug transport system fused ATPase/permease subunit n=1 Tax=Microlunatus parietis TaxID=682979 RepID=A0A7Y9LC24_9ACTN|nr:ABC transporter ATP-binding protein [Microlunatus parietis]NYE74414.1 ABC-type multidrug transport system fused ATPase/permease subunit [Microlunatus parietis]
MTLSTSPSRSSSSRTAKGPTADGIAAAPSAGVVFREGLGRLFSACWERRLIFIPSVLSGVAFALLQVLTSTVIGQVTQDVIVPSFESGNPVPGAVAAAGLLVAGIAVLRAVTVVGRRTLASVTQFHLIADYRLRLTRRLSELPLLWHRRQSTGTLLSTMYSDIEATFFAIAPFPFALATLAMLAYAVVVVAGIDPVLLLIMVVTVAILMALNMIFQAKAAPIALESQRLRAEVSEIAHESFDGAGVVKSLGREDAEEVRFVDAADRLRRNGIRLGYVRGWFDPVIDALPNVAILLVTLVGTWRIGQGALTTGQLVQVAYLFTLMALPLRSFGWVLGDLSRVVVGWRRTRRILTARDRLGYGTRTAPDTGRPARVEFQGVTLEYRDSHSATGRTRPDAVALHEVDLTADAETDGRVVAIVGATGSGKSTLTLLASRLLDPTDGRITLDGVDLRDLTADSLAESVALVLQQAFVFDSSVRDNVTLGENFSDADVRWALRIAQAEGFVDALPEGLDTVLGERGGSLSGGQRQRIALARALVRRPRLLVLDDATSACDPAVEAAILEGIHREITETTLLVVAYRKSTIAIASRVVFLENGRITATGSHAELLADVPAYRALVEAYDEAAIAHELLESERAELEDRAAAAASNERARAERERADAEIAERKRAERERAEREHGKREPSPDDPEVWVELAEERHRTDCDDEDRLMEER